MERLLTDFLLAAHAASFLIEAQGRVLAAGELLPQGDEKALQTRFAEQGIFLEPDVLTLCATCDGLTMKKPYAEGDGLIDQYFLICNDEIVSDFQMRQEIFKNIPLQNDFWPFLGGGDGYYFVKSINGTKDSTIGYFLYDEPEIFCDLDIAFRSASEMIHCLTEAIKEGIDPTANSVDDPTEVARFEELCLKITNGASYWREATAGC